MKKHGAVAEWLRSGLQNRVHRFNSGRHLQENQKQVFVFMFGALTTHAERHLQENQPLKTPTLAGWRNWYTRST